MSTVRQYAPITVFLLVMWALMTIRLDAPWFGHQDENGAWISAGIRNYRLYGADNLGFLQVLNTEPATPETYEYYVHHPPLIVWLAALSSAVFGFSEAAVRLVAISSTLIGTAAFYVLCRRLFDDRRALVCVVLFGLTPMIAYFGRMPNHEPPALMFLLLFSAVYVNWLRKPSRARWLGLAACAVLAMWSAWAPAFFFLMFGLITLWQGTSAQRRSIVELGIVTAAATVAIMLFYEVQHRGAIDELLHAFAWRSSSESARRGSETFTIVAFLSRQLLHLITMGSFAVTILGLAGIVVMIRDAKKTNRLVVLALLVGPTLYMLVFRNAFFIHDYYKIYFMPGLVIAMSYVLFIDYPQHIIRFIQPALMGVLVASLAASAFWFVRLHQSGEQDFPRRLVSGITNYTTVDDLILTNLLRVSSAIEFYTFQDMVWEVSPSRAVEMAQVVDRRVIYVFCPGEQSIPDELSNMPFELVAECRLINLKEAE